VVQSDRTITRFQTQKTGALLGYLALNLQSSHSREVLAELLWPGGDPIAVRNRLNQAVSSLRRQLEPANVVYGSVLLTDQRSIRLVPEAIVTDVEEFQKLIHKAETTEANHQRKIFLKKAAELYGGEFLQGYYSDWVGMEQLRLSDMYLNALYDLLDVSRDTGDFELAIRAANLILKGDPADEGTHCDLMRLYIDAGRHSAAKRQFEELTRILAAEEAVPSDEARELSLEATTKRASPSSPTLMAEAANAPADIEIPEFGGSSFPSPTNRFVGRETDIRKLTANLTEDSTRLITIVGLGGSGKTRLALQVARGLHETFANSVFFVPLADTKDARHIEEMIAQAIGMRGSENLIKRLQRNETTLLLLDNFEQLAEQGAELVQSLLEEVSSLKCLVTSRQPLRIDSERIYPLAPLPIPKVTDSVDDLVLNPSVALFVDRAQAALPDFQITPRNSDIVRQICQRLEGLPLAIELVASWAKTVAPGQMIAMLADRFALLESRRRDISARHRTMRAVIDSSVGLLSPELQSLFYKLSVFQGGWSLESAAQVCATPQILSAMDGLTEHSLIQIDDADAESIRFRMLDTLRDYASEHVPAAVQAECANAHAAFFTVLADEGAEQLLRNDQGLWIARLEAEYANFTAAFRWYLDHSLVEPALRLANALTIFWELWGRTGEGRNWIETALDHVDDANPVDAKTRAQAMNNLARMIWVHGDFAESICWHDQALEAWQAIGDTRGIIAAQFNIQLEAHRTRNYARSKALLEDNLERAERIGDKYIQTRCWLALGNNFVELRQLEEARRHYEQSLQIARDIENKLRIAMALNNLGNLATLLEQYELARHYLLEAVSLLEEIGARPSITDTLLHLAKLERRQNDIPAALKWLEKVWKNAPEETYHIQGLFVEQAFAAYGLGNPSLAAVFLGFVDRQREELGALNVDIELSEYDGLIASLRGTLSASNYESAWRLGRDLDLQKAAARRLTRAGRGG